MFVSYLWGIETSWLAPNDKIQEIVCIVPMRNWNTAFGILLAVGLILRLYRTYEELKHWKVESCGIFSSPSLYRTYEELKLENEFRILADRALFVLYLWGIETRKWIPYPCRSGTVCIVPMRNWNCRIRSRYSTIAIVVCIVPMRNWNSAWTLLTLTQTISLYRTYEELKPWTSFCVLCCRRVFVSYLWGIETLSCAKKNLSVS